MLAIIVCAACTPIDSPRHASLDAGPRPESTRASGESRADSVERTSEDADASVARERSPARALADAGARLEAKAPERPKKPAADSGTKQLPSEADSGSMQRAPSAGSHSDADAGDMADDAGPRTVLRWPAQLDANRTARVPS